MSSTALDSSPLSTTFGSSERTTRARVPSSESSLPRMMSLLITRWIKLWYPAPSGKTSGNSGGGKPPLGGGGSRAENSEIMPRAPSTSCRSMTSWRNFSTESRSSSDLPSTTTSTSYSLDGNSCVTCWYSLNSGVSERNNWPSASSILILWIPRTATIAKMTATMIDRPGKRNGSNANRSAPRATRKCFSAARSGNDGVSLFITKVPNPSGETLHQEPTRRPFCAPAP